VPSRRKWPGSLSLAVFPFAALILGAIVVSLSIPGGPPIPAPGGRAAPERGFYRLRSGTEMVKPGDPLFATPAGVRLVRQDGSVITGLELASGPVILAFWAPACPACDADAAALATVLDGGRVEGVPAAGVWLDTQTTRDAWDVADAIRRLSLVDTTGASLEQRVVFGAPTHLLVVDGRTVERHLGPLDPDAFRAAARRLSPELAGPMGTPWP
jgi:thiol-disulfide isomerase/thioredoxin